MNDSLPIGAGPTVSTITARMTPAIVATDATALPNPTAANNPRTAAAARLQAAITQGHLGAAVLPSAQSFQAEPPAPAGIRPSPVRTEAAREQDERRLEWFRYNLEHLQPGRETDDLDRIMVMSARLRQASRFEVLQKIPELIARHCNEPGNRALIARRNALLDRLWAAAKHGTAGPNAAATMFLARALKDFPVGCRRHAFDILVAETRLLELRHRRKILATLATTVRHQNFPAAGSAASAFSTLMAEICQLEPAMQWTPAAILFNTIAELHDPTTMHQMFVNATDYVARQPSDARELMLKALVKGVHGQMGDAAEMDCLERQLKLIGQLPVERAPKHLMALHRSLPMESRSAHRFNVADAIFRAAERQPAIAQPTLLAHSSSQAMCLDAPECERFLMQILTRLNGLPEAERDHALQAVVRAFMTATDQFDYDNDLSLPDWLPERFETLLKATDLLPIAQRGQVLEKFRESVMRFPPALIDEAFLEVAVRMDRLPVEAFDGMRDH